MSIHRCKDREYRLFSFKHKEILPFLTIRINVEDIMLSEISQMEKDKYCMISFMCGLLKKKNKKTKKQGMGEGWGDFPKTSPSQYKAPGFNPWSGN